MPKREQPKRFEFPIAFGLTFLLLFCSVVQAQQDARAEPLKQIVVTGRVADSQETDCCNESEVNGAQSSPRFSLKTLDGKVYKFLMTDAATAMVADPQVRSRELQIAAVVHSNGELEIIKVHSVREGKLYDLYYYCEVCNITAYAPGSCPCCYGKFELKETPAAKQ